MGQAHTTDVWDQVAKQYHANMINQPDYQADLRVLLEYTGDPQGKTFCEVGCGSGTTSVLLARQGAHIVLVDRSPAALDSARKLFASLELYAEFYCQDALEMDLPCEAFDVVWNAGVIEHFLDEEKIKLLQSMWERVRPGGVLFCSSPNRYDLPFMLGKMIKIRRGTWRYGYEDDLTAGRFKRLGARAGLRNIEIIAYNPITGWKFLPRGRAMIAKLGLDTLQWHIKRCFWGHIVALVARKT